MVALKHKGRTLTFRQEDQQTSWGTYHDDQTVNRDQAEKLMRNLQAKKEELIKSAVRQHLGHLPSTKKARKYLQIVSKTIGDIRTHWVHWRKTCVAVYTDPTSRIENRRYILTWYWRTLV